MKNVVIFGDSYSTFEGYIPQGYDIFYSDVNPRPDTDVRKVDETWWYQVMEEANLNLVLNDSWSGSTIGYTGYDGEDNSTTASFIRRLDKLIEEGFFKKNTIDTVFVFGGTNDSWADAPLGSVQYDHHKKEDLYFVLPAICYFLKKLKSTLPEAKIYCLINTDIKPEIVDCFRQACEKMDITPIAFDHIDKLEAHPTIKGMQDIKNQVMKTIDFRVTPTQMME